MPAQPLFGQVLCDIKATITKRSRRCALERIFGALLHSIVLLLVFSPLLVFAESTSPTHHGSKVELELIDTLFHAYQFATGPEFREIELQLLSFGDDLREYLEECEISDCGRLWRRRVFWLSLMSRLEHESDIDLVREAIGQVKNRCRIQRIETVPPIWIQNELIRLGDSVAPEACAIILSRSDTDNVLIGLLQGLSVYTGRYEADVDSLIGVCAVPPYSWDVRREALECARYRGITGVSIVNAAFECINNESNYRAASALANCVYALSFDPEDADRLERLASQQSSEYARIAFAKSASDLRTRLSSSKLIEKTQELNARLDETESREQRLLDYSVGLGGILPALESMESAREEIVALGGDQAEAAYAIGSLKAHLYEGQILAIQSRLSRNNRSLDMSVSHCKQDLWVAYDTCVEVSRFRVKLESDDPDRTAWEFSKLFGTSAFPGKREGNLEGDVIVTTANDTHTYPLVELLDDLFATVCHARVPIVFDGEMPADHSCTVTFIAIYRQRKPGIPYSFFGEYYHPLLPIDTIETTLHFKSEPPLAWGGHYKHLRGMVEFEKTADPTTGPFGPFGPFEYGMGEWRSTKNEVTSIPHYTTTSRIVGLSQTTPVLSFIQVK